MDRFIIYFKKLIIFGINNNITPIRKDADVRMGEFKVYLRINIIKDMDKKKY